MPIDNDATIAPSDVHRLVTALRAGEHYYEDGYFVATIAPHHFATPEARGALWEMIARLVELEDEAPVAYRSR